MNAYDIPTTVDINGREMKIRNDGDFRVVLDCFSALSDVELTETERLYASLIIFYEDFNTLFDVGAFPYLKEAVAEMYNFFNCGEENIGAKAPYKLVDWDKDSQLISSAINNVAHKEVRAEKYLHWWTYMGYYTAIGECPLSTIVGIRSKIMKHKKLEKHEREFRQENPQYFIWNSYTVEQAEAQKEAENWLNEIWNKKEEE